MANERLFLVAPNGETFMLAKTMLSGWYSRVDAAKFQADLLAWLQENCPDWELAETTQPPVPAVLTEYQLAIAEKAAKPAQTSARGLWAWFTQRAGDLIPNEAYQVLAVELARLLTANHDLADIDQALAHADLAFAPLPAGFNADRIENPEP